MKTQKNNRKYDNNKAKESRALNLFAEMMIEKIEAIKDNWHKPWFTEGLSWPRNLQGREYNGMNTLMLLMHCEKQGYQTPVFLTHNRCLSMNFIDSPQGRVPAIDADGNRLSLTAFGSPEYAREELVAELGAALTAQRYGFDACISDESAAYLKSWLKSLKEQPQFIKTTLTDVRRATSMLTQCLDALGAEVKEQEVKPKAKSQRKKMRKAA